MLGLSERARWCCAGQWMPRCFVSPHVGWRQASVVIAACCMASSCLSRGMLWGVNPRGLASMLLTSAQNWNGRGESDCLIKT